MGDNKAESEAQSQDCKKIGTEPCGAVFIGVDALVKRLSALGLSVTDIKVNCEINDIAAELFLLDSALERLQRDRSWVDVEDVDRFIARLRAA